MEQKEDFKAELFLFGLIGLFFNGGVSTFTLIIVNYIFNLNLGFWMFFPVVLVCGIIFIFVMVGLFFSLLLSGKISRERENDDNDNNNNHYNRP